MGVATSFALERRACYNCHMTLDPALRQRMATIGRVGGLTSASRVGPAAMAERARGGFMAKFERQVDPEGELEPVERAERARMAMRAHMARLANRRWA